MGCLQFRRAREAADSKSSERCRLLLLRHLLREGGAGLQARLVNNTGVAAVRDCELVMMHCLRLYAAPCTACKEPELECGGKRCGYRPDRRANRSRVCVELAGSAWEHVVALLRTLPTQSHSIAFCKACSLGWWHVLSRIAPEVCGQIS